MNMMDMIVVAVLCFYMIRGIFRGLSSELASIIGVIAGFYGAFLFYPRVVELLPAKIAAGVYADILGFAIIFCGVFLFIHLLGVLIRFALGITMLSWVDRLLGAGFGIFKGALFLGVVFFIFARFIQPTAPVMQESILYGYATTAAEAVADRNFYDLPATIKSKIEGLETSWKKRGR